MRSWVMGLVALLGGCKSSEFIDAVIVRVEVDIRFECASGTCANQPTSTPLTSLFTSQPRGVAPAPDPGRDPSIRFVGACSSRGPAFATYHALRHELDGGSAEAALTFGAVGGPTVVASQVYERPGGDWMAADLYTLDGAGVASQLRAPAWADGGVSEYRLNFQTPLADGGWETDLSGATVIETHTLTSTTERVELQYRELCQRGYY